MYCACFGLILQCIIGTSLQLSEPHISPLRAFNGEIYVCCWIPYITITQFLGKKIIKKVTHSRSNTLQGLSTETVYLVIRECRRHYSSWGVSRESQSSPLRFFVESIATDHQEVSSFFSEKKSVLSGRRTRDLEPRNRLTDHPATVTYLILVCYVHYLYLPLVYKLKKMMKVQSQKPIPALELLNRLV